MMDLKIKVCGMTQLQQLQELKRAEVDFLGFIFYPKSPRFVLPHLRIEELGAFAHPGKVGVFVNENLKNLISIVQKSKLNFVQLHGDEDFSYIENLKNELPDLKIIRAVRVEEEQSTLRKKIQEFNAHKAFLDFLLFDKASAVYGGTGSTFNWELLGNLETDLPFFLSGGIGLEELDKLTELLPEPYGIDVNSKFEVKPGVKDMEKIGQLIQKIRK